MVTKEKDIVHERGNFWVCDERRDYTVYKNGITHAKSDSSYAHTEDGLSLARARCDYLAHRNK